MKMSLAITLQQKKKEKRKRWREVQRKQILGQSWIPALAHWHSQNSHPNVSVLNQQEPITFSLASLYFYTFYISSTPSQVCKQESLQLNKFIKIKFVVKTFWQENNEVLDEGRNM